MSKAFDPSLLFRLYDEYSINKGGKAIGKRNDKGDFMSMLRTEKPKGVLY